MKKFLLIMGLLFTVVTPLFSQQAFLATNFSAAGNNGGIKLISTGVAYNGATWTKSGTVSVCSFVMDSSTDGITWNNGDVLGATSCATNGQSAYTNAVYNYVRARVTSFTGTGSVNITQIGYINSPAALGSAPGSPNTSVQFNDGGVFGGDANFLYDKTISSVFISPPLSSYSAIMQNQLSLISAATSNFVGINTATNSEGFIAVAEDGTVDTFMIGVTGIGHSYAGGNGVGISGTGILSGSVSSSNQAFGGQFFGSSQGSVGSGFIYGIQANSANQGTGTNVQLFGLSIEQNLNTGGGTVLSNTGLDIGDEHGVGTTNYALHIANQGTGANDYAIKVEGGKSDLGPQSTTVGSLLTTANCSAVGSGANPSVAACGSAPSGAFSCATNASTGTCQVNTTAVTANSNIIVQQVKSEGTRLSVTCNTASVLPAGPLLLSKSAGASFTLTMGTITSNPGCFVYWIVN